MKRFTGPTLLLSLIIFSMAIGSEKRALTFEDFFSLKRIKNIVVSPDGKKLACEIKIPDFNNNDLQSDIFVFDMNSEILSQLTFNDKNSSAPVWSPDGKNIYFNRDSQIWMKNLQTGETKQITNFIAGAASAVISSDGSKMLFKSSVYPDCESVECQEKYFLAAENQKATGKIIDELLYRHWNSWRDSKYSHIFLAKPNGKIIKDITPGAFDTPPISLGSSQDYVISPDGKEICFVRNTDKIVASSTNNDVYIYNIKNNKMSKISESMGNDNHPVYSPDGRYIAFRSMSRAGFEADKYRLFLYDRKTSKNQELLPDFQLSASSLVWNPSGTELYFTTDEEGCINLYSVRIKDRKLKPVLKNHYISKVQFFSDKEIVFLNQSASMPNEIFKMDVRKGQPIRISSINDDVLSHLELPSYEPFWFKGAKGERVQGFILKPPFFDASKKYPAIELIHGGPQGAWGDDFHFRWNYQMFSAPGYVVFMINFHGSRGYGQDFTDAVSRDWGGAPYEDIVLGTQYVLDNYSFIDKNRLAAAGASYGGFMVNWIAGHENPFKCLISHDGVYEQISMYGATEELWFPEWEFNGTPWEDDSLYEKWSPARMAGNFNTPMLVIHGELDYRVPYTQGLQLFSALQRQGVKSRLLFFPDEDHFVQKPHNAKLWWKTVHEWIAEFVN